MRMNNLRGETMIVDRRLRRGWQQSVDVLLSSADLRLSMHQCYTGMHWREREGQDLIVQLGTPYDIPGPVQRVVATVPASTPPQDVECKLKIQTDSFGYFDDPGTMVPDALTTLTDNKDRGRRGAIAVEYGQFVAYGRSPPIKYTLSSRPSSK
jgi:hypothetical protein